MKRKASKGIVLLLLINLFAFHTQKAITQQNYLAYSVDDKTVSFIDNFENNSNQWITDNLWISGKVQNGHYQITCKNYQQSTGLSSKSIRLEKNSDFEIETSFRVINGTGALLFGMNDQYDHYRIELSDKNLLEILKDTPSKRKKVEKLFSGNVSSNISKDSYNKITVRSVKNIYFVFLNESYIGRFSNIKLDGDQVGFSVGINSEISVDYLKVFTLKQQIPLPVSTSDSPIIAWVSPSSPKTNLEGFSARIRANVKSTSGLNSVLVYVNGVSKGEAEIKPIPGETGGFLVETNISFGPGENNIYLVATNRQGATKSDLRYFTNPSAVPPAISWSTPDSPNSIVSVENFAIGACINSPTELRSVRLLVNGVTQVEDNIIPASGSENCNYTWQSSVVLKEGENSIFLIATNIAGTTTSEKRSIRLEPDMAEKRLALIIGNSNYRNNTVLKNPVNDANLMEGTLKELGFEVIKRINAGKDDMMAAIREFNDKLPAYNVALFYYAGHGVQVDGKNYLIPIDALLEKPSDSRFEAIGVDFIVEEFERYPDNTNIVILDACRNNPYTAWTRGNDAGFRAVTFSSGSIIAFATSEGATADDGKGANGLFTEELVKQMAIPQSIYNVFMNTRVQVRRLSNGKQIPTEWNKLNGDFFFKR